MTSLILLATSFLATVATGDAAKCYSCSTPTLAAYNYGWLGLNFHRPESSDHCLNIRRDLTPSVECSHGSSCVEILINATILGGTNPEFSNKFAYNFTGTDPEHYFYQAAYCRFGPVDFIRDCQYDLTRVKTGDICESGYFGDRSHIFLQHIVCSQDYCNNVSYSPVEPCNQGRPKKLNCPVCHGDLSMTECNPNQTMHCEGNWCFQLRRNVSIYGVRDLSVDKSCTSINPFAATGCHFMTTGNGSNVDHFGTCYFEDSAATTAKTHAWMLTTCLTSLSAVILFLWH